MAKPKQLLIRVTNKMSQSGVGNLEQLWKLSRVLIVSFPQDFHKTVSNADSIPAFSFHRLTFRPNSILTSSTYCQRTLKYWRRLSYSNFCGFSSNWILLYFPLFVCSFVTGVTSYISHIYKGINGGPIKPYIFWIKIFLAIFLAKTRPDKTVFSALTNLTIDFDFKLSKV